MATSRQVVARVGFAERERQPQLAAGQRRQPATALRRRAGFGQQLAGQHDARQPRPAAEAAPEFLCDEHQLDGALPAAAELRIERQAEQPELGHAGPARRGELGRFEIAALVRRVFAVAEALHRVAQCDVVVIQREVHLGASVQAARKALAIRLRCTSLAPP